MNQLRESLKQCRLEQDQCQNEEKSAELKKTEQQINQRILAIRQPITNIQKETTKWKQETAIHEIALLHLYSQKLKQQFQTEEKVSNEILLILNRKNIDDSKKVLTSIREIFSTKYYGEIQKFILQKINDYFLLDESKAPPTISTFQSNLLQSLSSAKVFNIISEFTRAIRGGYLYFALEGETEIAPFQTIEGESQEEEEARLAEWVKAAERFVSQHALGDPELITHFSQLLNRSGTDSRMSPIGKHANVFDLLFENFENPRNLDALLKPIVAQLQEKKTSIQTVEQFVEILNFLMKIYRSATQTLLIIFLGVILEGQKTIFQKVDPTIVETSSREADHETKSIKMNAVSGGMEVHLLYKRNFKGFETGHLCQEIQYTIPFPGSQKKMERPEVQVYYKRPQPTEENIQQFDSMVTELQYILSSRAYPPLKEDITPDLAPPSY